MIESNTHEISHREIYERVVSLELKVDALKQDTSGLVVAFNAAAGAFQVLEWLAKLAKPLLFIGALVTAAGVAWQNWRAH